MNRSLLFASLLLATATLQAQDPKPATPVTTTPAATEPQAVAPATAPATPTAGAASEHLEAQVLLDPRNAMTEVAGSRALPTTLFYDANGQLQGMRVGELSTASLNEFMEKIAPAPH